MTSGPLYSPFSLWSLPFISTKEFGSHQEIEISSSWILHLIWKMVCCVELAQHCLIPAMQGWVRGLPFLSLDSWDGEKGGLMVPNTSRAVVFRLPVCQVRWQRTLQTDVPFPGSLALKSLFGLMTRARLSWSLDHYLRLRAVVAHQRSFRGRLTMSRAIWGCHTGAVGGVDNSILCV